MKNFSAVILLFTFSTQFIYSAVVITWFVANRNYVASALCVNKDKPQMRCNGKCFLNKKLNEPASNQDNHSAKEIKKLIETAPYIIVTKNDPEAVRFIAPIVASHIKDHYHFINSPDIFHPPSPAFS